MIEGMAILVVFGVATLLYLTTLVQAQKDNRVPGAERKRLAESLSWHEARLQEARDRNWDAVMVSQIDEQLADTRRQLARVGARPRG